MICMVVLERELECDLAVTSKDQVTLVLNAHYLLDLVFRNWLVVQHNPKFLLEYPRLLFSCGSVVVAGS